MNLVVVIELLDIVLVQCWSPFYSFFVSSLHYLQSADSFFLESIHPAKFSSRDATLFLFFFQNPVFVEMSNLQTNNSIELLTAAKKVRTQQR